MIDKGNDQLAHKENLVTEESDIFLRPLNIVHTQVHEPGNVRHD